MSKGDVTVVIPTVGRPELARALESVRNQTSTVETLIVVDDLTKIGFVENMLQDAHERVVATAGRVGGGAARALGVTLADTEYCAFLDDDDWWEPQKTELQLNYLRPASTKAVSFTKSFFHRAGRQTQVVPRLPVPSGNSAKHSISSYLLVRRRMHYGDSFLQSSSLMTNTQLLLNTNWDPTLAKHQDWDLIIRLVEHGGAELGMIDLPLVHVPQGSEGSVSRVQSWEGSLAWARSIEECTAPRAHADFLSAIALRSALSKRDLPGTLSVLRELRRPPHMAALALGLRGLARR